MEVQQALFPTIATTELSCIFGGSGITLVSPNARLACGFGVAMNVKASSGPNAVEVIRFLVADGGTLISVKSLLSTVRGQFGYIIETDDELIDLLLTRVPLTGAVVFDMRE